MPQSHFILKIPNDDVAEEVDPRIVAAALEEIADRLHADGFAGDVVGVVRIGGTEVGRWELT